MGTLADLVSGFQGGYSGVQDARRKRKLNQAIDYELGKEEEGRIGRQQGRERLGYGGGYEGADFTMPQTYGERLVGFIKGKFGASTGQQNTTAIDPGMQQPGFQPPGMQQSGAQTFAMPQAYKDGGAVRNMKRQAISGYADGGSVAEELAKKNAAARAKYETAARQRSMSPSQIAEETARNAPKKSGMSKVRSGVGKAGKVAAPVLLGATAIDTATTDTDDYRERFALPRDQGGDIEDAGQMGDKWYSALGDPEFYGDVGVRALGAASDLGSALTFGASDALYRDKQAGGQAIAPDAKKAAVTEAVAPPDVAAQPAGDPPNTQTPQAKAAAQPAGPPDEIVDFSQVRDVMPEDMPNMAVTDWEDERRFWAAQAISLGNDPFEAMKAVDQRQMRGFTSYGQQAFQMLQAGDATGAARALYAAYQYFPNGADVKFGVQKGVNGQPVLIGMGTDEKTGEPLKEGKPQVITPESLSVQLENMSNPSAFRTWTKDWRDTEQEIREYNEVTKPEAASNARYRDRAGQAAVLRAQADYNSSLGAGTGGLKKTDLDRANSAFMEAVEMEGFKNPEQADAMMDMMAQIYQRHAPNVEYPTVIRDVRDAIRSGDTTALDQKYGQ